MEWEHFIGNRKNHCTAWKRKRTKEKRDMILVSAFWEMHPISVIRSLHHIVFYWVDFFGGTVHISWKQKWTPFSISLYRCCSFNRIALVVSTFWHLSAASFPLFHSYLIHYLPLNVCVCVCFFSTLSFCERIFASIHVRLHQRLTNAE